MKDLLIARGYKQGIINAAITKAKTISRSEAIKKVPQKTNTGRRPILVINYDPRLPSISNILKKHWRTMTTDPYLKEAFPHPPWWLIKGLKILKTKS